MNKFLEAFLLLAMAVIFALMFVWGWQ